MSDDIKISIVVPFYKVEKYFRRCLDSIVNQTLKEIEIILIDDCGGDKSIEIAEEYAQNDSRIKIVRNEKNSGQGYSRNLGIKMAKGEYIAFVDSDDWLESNMYEVLYDKAKEKDADIIKCDFRYIWQNSTTVYNIKNICSDFDKIYTVKDDSLRFLGLQTTAIWNGMYKRDFLEKFKISFDEVNKFEDMIFCWQTILKANRIVFVDEVLCNYNKINLTSDTNISKYVIEFITKDLKLLRELVIANNLFHNSYILYSYNSLVWILPKVSVFKKRSIFKIYNKFLIGLETDKINKIIEQGLATKQILYYVNGDYKKFMGIEKTASSIFNRFKRSLIYAKW